MKSHWERIWLRLSVARHATCLGSHRQQTSSLPITGLASMARVSSSRGASLDGRLGTAPKKKGGMPEGNDPGNSERPIVTALPEVFHQNDLAALLIDHVEQQTLSIRREGHSGSQRLGQRKHRRAQ